MSHLNLKILGLLVFLLVAVYVSFFAGSSFLFLFVFLRNLFSDNSFPVREMLGWFTVGVSLSLLASLTAWPFALAITTLLEHNKSRSLSRYFLKLLSYLSSLPLVLFVFAYLSIFGNEGFNFIKVVWTVLFASKNFFTDAIAFALTLLLYPLTIFMKAADQPTIDHFYHQMLAAVIEFAEVGLVATVVAVALFLFVLPKMILHMRKQLMDDENIRSTEIIKSLGGTPWESIHLTVMQSMKTKFNEIILHFTKKCFFEGLITFSILNAFFFRSIDGDYHWSSSLSSMFVRESVSLPKNLEHLMVLAGFLVLAYFVFTWFERRHHV